VPVYRARGLKQTHREESSRAFGIIGGIEDATTSYRLEAKADEASADSAPPSRATVAIKNWRVINMQGRDFRGKKARANEGSNPLAGAAASANSGHPARAAAVNIKRPGPEGVYAGKGLEKSLEDVSQENMNG